jgi:GNAT superfamily N-acetyltransferase
VVADLNQQQFDPRARQYTPRGRVGGERQYQTSVTGRNGRTYYMKRERDESIGAFAEEPFEHVGNLSTWRGPSGGREVFKVRVSEEHRRQGVASAMLDLARKYDPDLAHSGDVALSPDGKKWAAARP